MDVSLRVTVCGNSFFHAGAMLLLNILDIQSRSVDEDDLTKVPSPFPIASCKEAANSRCQYVLTSQLQNDPIFHAREVCGISTSNNDQFSLPSLLKAITCH